jgi:Family of unknown function (DUF5309)
MAILGLISAESFSTQRFKNVRRSVFYFYPNGAAPLMGLLSLMKEEVTNDPEYDWYEKRLQPQRTITSAISGNICLYSTVSADFGTWTAATGNFVITAGQQYGTKVDVNTNGGTANFRVGHLIKYNVIVSAVLTSYIGRVTYVDAANNRLAFVAVQTTGTITYNSASGIGVEVWIVGNAFAEGTVGSSYNAYNLPVQIYNYTQIFRTAFQITGTALKTSAKYDETGPYKDQAKEASVNHMIEMEKNFIFGQQRLDTTGATPLRYTGGVLWFLQQYEAQYSQYRGGDGSSVGPAAVTLDTDDDKRIINNTNNYLTEKQYDGYLERVFRVTNNKANEKLVLCGSGFLNVVNQLYKSKAVLNADLPLTETYGMNVVAHQTPFGKIYYKSHPLFSQNPVLRYNALFLDVLNLRYRYMNGRDTELLTMRQPNNADYREDEWLSEAGLELEFPESNMYLQNVLDYR